jgi:hypothetical protein
MLKTQLVLKGVMTIDEFHNIKELIQFDFLQDGHFTELKEAELMENKLQTLQSVESYVGTFFSKKWVQNNVLRLTDLEIEDMQQQINKEAGIDPEDGGVDVPDNTDGITRYPSMDGAPIPPDDIDDGSPKDDKEGDDK